MNATPWRLIAVCLLTLAVGWRMRGSRSGEASRESATDTAPRRSVACRRVPPAHVSDSTSRWTAEPDTVEVLEIPVNRGVAECQVWGAPQTRYEVVIGSLGPGDESVEVHLDWEPFDCRIRAPSRPREDDLRGVGGSPLAQWRRITAPGEGFTPVPKPASLPEEDNAPGSIQNDDVSPGHQREFDFPVWQPAGRGAGEWRGKPIIARLLGAHPRVRVYVDLQDADGRVSRRAAATIARRLAEIALPVVESWLGPITDVDGDGSLSVLVTSEVEQLPQGSDPLRAFVRAADLAAGPPKGSRTSTGPLDIIYLNAHRLEESGLDGILAHEATHLAVFCRRRDAGLALRAEEWIDEGLAHAVEWLGTGESGNLEKRWAAFDAAPQAAALEVNRGVGNPAWRRPECRGATARFFTYLVADRGVTVLPRIATAQAAGRDALAEATGQSFADLFRGWTIVDRIHWHDPETVPDTPAPGRQTWALAGTAALRFSLGQLAADQGYRLRLTGPASTPLQLTLVRHVRPHVSKPGSPSVTATTSRGGSLP